MASTAAVSFDKNAEKTAPSTTTDDHKKKIKRKVGEIDSSQEKSANAHIDKKIRGSMQAHRERCEKRRAREVEEEAEAKKTLEKMDIANRCCSTVLQEEHKLQIELERLRKAHEHAPKDFFQWAADLGSAKLARCRAPLEKFNVDINIRQAMYARAVKAAEEYKKVASTTKLKAPEFACNAMGAYSKDPITREAMKSYTKEAEAAAKEAALEFYVYLRDLSAWTYDNKALRGDVLMPTIRGPYSKLAMRYIREAYLALGCTDVLNAALSDEQSSDVRKNPPVPPGAAWSKDSADWVIEITQFILEYSHHQRVFAPWLDPQCLGFAVGPNYASDHALMKELAKCTTQCPNLSCVEKLKIAEASLLYDDEDYFKESANEALAELKKESRKRHGRPPTGDESDHDSDDDPCDDSDAEFDDKEDDDDDDDAGCPSG
jgi:hypothetical protein